MLHTLVTVTSDSDFERGMVIGPRRAGLSFQKCWSTGIHPQPSLRFTENGQKKRKNPLRGSSVGRNALLMAEAEFGINNIK